MRVALQHHAKAPRKTGSPAPGFVLLDVVDSLRCVAGHEESWLVATVSEWRGREVIAGTLGCPTCRAEYPIAEGVADFSGHSPVRDTAAAADPPILRATDALRLAAQLDLRDAGGVVVLTGGYAALGAELLAIVDVNCVLVNPPPSSTPAHISVVRCHDRWPLAAGSVRGLAFDPAAARTSLLLDAPRVLRAGGRLVAPIGVALPPGATALLQDEREWIASVEGQGSAPVPITRRAR